MAESNPFLLVIPSSITPGGGFLRDFQCVKTSLPLHEYQLYAVEQWYDRLLLPTCVQRLVTVLTGTQQGCRPGQACPYHRGLHE